MILVLKYEVWRRKIYEERREKSRQQRGLTKHNESFATIGFRYSMMIQSSQCHKFHSHMSPLKLGPITTRHDELKNCDERKRFMGERIPSYPEDFILSFEWVPLWAKDSILSILKFLPSHICELTSKLNVMGFGGNKHLKYLISLTRSASTCNHRIYFKLI